MSLSKRSRSNNHKGALRWVTQIYNDAKLLEDIMDRFPSGQNQWKVILNVFNGSVPEARQRTRKSIISKWRDIARSKTSATVQASAPRKLKGVQRDVTYVSSFMFPLRRLFN